MVHPGFSLHTFVAAAVAFIAAGSSPMFASALDLTVADCADFAALPTTAMTEDVNLYLDDATIAFICDEVTTVTVDGPYTSHVTSTNDNVTFTNVRFEILGRANFSFTLESKRNFRAATFTGITGLASDGGVFKVESGSHATFLAPVKFESNSVTTPYSGGAVYAAGKVDFKYYARFSENKVLRDGDRRAYNGGALCVADTGVVTFKYSERRSYFFLNEAESGGQGGAVANFGYLLFEPLASFANNTAREDGEQAGGNGGAIFTGPGSFTSFHKYPRMQHNSGASGGALYNLGTTAPGTTALEAIGYFYDNEALGADEASGGHIYTSGGIYSSARAIFRDGSSRGDGGAVYIDNGGSFFTDGKVTYIDNAAPHQCDNVFARGQDRVCKP